MSTSQENVTPTGREQLVAQMRRWRKRRRIAFWVQVVTAFLTLALAAPATALLLGQINSMREDFIPQRHVPGADGSISIMAPGSYVLIRHEAELPDKCVVKGEDGYQLLTEPWRFGSQPEGLQFYAEPGRYDVTCDGGQDGVVALNRTEYERSMGGPWRLANPAWPMYLGALVLFYGGRVAASRIAPESMRPLYPA
ncbi:MAG: hypothetical protein Q4G35_08230 [Propionibacteriaceae bacterium]|nr:hypothetical protein [Propionibacteriaceae bacterium]